MPKPRHLITLLAVLYGCGDPTGNQVALSELEQSRERWAQQAISTYTYRVQRICFCAFVDPVDVTVRDGHITSIVVTSSQEELDPSMFSQYYTVDGLFEVVRDALDRDAHSVVVAYDTEFGYPVDVAIDYIEMAADDELQLLSSDLQQIP
jgi:hypothetical protein